MAITLDRSVAARRCMRLALAPLLVAVSLVLATCGAPPADSPTAVQIGCDLSSVAARGVSVDAVVLLLAKADRSDKLEVQLDIEGNVARGYVELSPGTWNLSAELYAQKVLVATGEGTAVVLPGGVTEVNLRVSLVNGAIDIEVEWDETPPLSIADISHRPAIVEISSIGTFMISGLSRVGWDVEVIETPSRVGWIDKEPGSVSFPDVAMLRLRSGSEEVASLAAWAAARTPGTMSLTLQGLGGESYRLNLYDVVPVAADTDVFGVEFSSDVEMAGIRVSVGWIEMAGYTETFVELPPKPEPGQWIEIDGVGADLGYADGVLAVPDVDSSDPLFLPSVRTGWVIFDWAREQLQEIAEYGSVYRRNLSVITMDDHGDETHRINFFEAWPASINLFNPEKPYGESFLIDVLIVCEFIEDA